MVATVAQEEVVAAMETIKDMGAVEEVQALMVLEVSQVLRAVYRQLHRHRTIINPRKPSLTKLKINSTRLRLLRVRSVTAPNYESDLLKQTITYSLHAQVSRAAATQSICQEASQIYKCSTRTAHGAQSEGQTNEKPNFSSWSLIRSWSTKSWRRCFQNRTTQQALSACLAATASTKCSAKKHADFQTSELLAALVSKSR